MAQTLDIARRRRVPELMDDPALAADQHVLALEGLERLNRASRSAAILWPSLAALANDRPPDAPLRVLDLATGGADVPIALERLARRAGLLLAIDACDISPTALEHARRRAAEAGFAGRLFRLDALRDELPRGYDAITCSLFLHHLDEAAAIRLLSRMAAATAGAVLVNDLRREPAGLLLAYLGSRALSRSRVVRTDATLSVRAAFTLGEARELAAAAGLENASIEPRWPFRFLLSWGLA